MREAAVFAFYRGFTLERTSRDMRWTIMRNGVYVNAQSTVSRAYEVIDALIAKEQRQQDELKAKRD